MFRQKKIMIDHIEIFIFRGYYRFRVFWHLVMRLNHSISINLKVI